MVRRLEPSLRDGLAWDDLSFTATDRAVSSRPGGNQPGGEAESGRVGSSSAGRPDEFSQHVGEMVEDPEVPCSLTHGDRAVGMCSCSR